MTKFAESCGPRQFTRTKGQPQQSRFCCRNRCRSTSRNFSFGRTFGSCPMLRSWLYRDGGRNSYFLFRACRWNTSGGLGEFPRGAGSSQNRLPILRTCPASSRIFWTKRTYPVSPIATCCRGPGVRPTPYECLFRPEHKVLLTPMLMFSALHALVQGTGSGKV